MPKDLVRWGLLSTARINERLIPVIQELDRNELIAVASRDGQKARSFAQQWNIPRSHESYEALLADDEIDAVYISLPNAMHAEWAIKAAQAGKHVLCEKPIALTPEDVERMSNAAADNGVTIHEAAMMRYHPQTNRVRDLLAEGKIGDVRILRGVFTFVLTNPGDIRTNRKLGGGSLWDLGSYPVNFMRTVMDANPVEVWGSQITNDDGVDLTFIGQMRFPSGAFGHFYSSFEQVPRVEADIHGTQGRITLDLPWVNKTEVESHVEIVSGGAAQPSVTFGDSANHLKTEVITYENVNGYRHEVVSVTSTILEGAPPVISSQDSIDNVATIAALYRSARERRPVEL